MTLPEKAAGSPVTGDERRVTEVTSINTAPAKPWRLGISKKIALLFSCLAITGFFNWQIVRDTLAEFDDAGARVNLAGSLRYRSQQLQTALATASLGDTGGADIETPITAFERALGDLQSDRHTGGATADNLNRRLAPVLAEIRAEWVGYRENARRFMRQPLPAGSALAELRRLSARGEKVLERTNRATRIMAEHVDGVQRRAVAELRLVAAIDVVILFIGFLAIRTQVVLPLRKMVKIGRRFADGDYGARVGLKSRDEIGELAEVIDHMAAETQEHIKAIASDLEQIRRSEGEFRKLSVAVECSPASVVITDANGAIQYVNKAFVEISGYSQREAIGRNPNILKSGATPLETYAQLWTTIQSGGIWRGELVNRRKNGELFWENTMISPVMDSEGKITNFIAVKEDVTARKHAEYDLRLLNGDIERRVAERTRQLEAAYDELRAFNYSVSHDLRAPLRAIHGFAHAIEEDRSGCLQGESLDHLHRIQRAAIRMGEMIDGLLELGRVGQMELLAQPTDLSKLARSILADLASQQPGRRVETDIEDGILVHGDPRLLRIALDNLLVNAWKFTAGRQPGRITFFRDRQYGENVLAIRDNGAGFSMAYADKLFRPFQRLHSQEAFEGTGIGLATVQRVIDMHHGEIWAEAEPDKGATFYFVLPEAPSVKSDLDRPQDSFPIEAH